MKKGIKKIAALVLAGMLSMSTMAMTVSADKWVAVNDGYKYQYDSGKYAQKGWLTIGASKYYIKSNGYRAVGLTKITETENKKRVTNYYYFDDNGVMQTGWQEIGGKKYYFNTKAGRRVTNKTVKIGNYCYKFNKDSVWTGKVYDKTGKKDVTKSVDAAKLTAPKGTTVTTEKLPAGVPKTVTIKGKTYNTQATNVFINKKADPVYPKGASDYESGEQLRWDIDISGCTDEDLECLKYFTKLQDLSLVSKWDNPAKITNLDFAYNMPNLKYVTIEIAPNLTNIDGLSAAKNIKTVNISYAGITNLDALSGCTKIDDVSFYATHLDNVNGLTNCENLEHVELSLCRLTDITGLKDKTKLKLLNLTLNRRLKDITPLTTCENLTALYINGCTSINTWDTLKEIPNLTYVAAQYNVIGKDGPKETIDWLNANRNMKYASYYEAKEGNDIGSKLHWGSKETKRYRSWDTEYRPAKVYGDDIQCAPGCEDCERQLTPMYASLC
ncbi:MAG: hypothetical protein J6C96_05915 [Oscillospiraceae bacterium]|nr:hypothetical protein [Oscillospiraceae bacterium]